MIQVNILTEGFVTPNGRAFLFPILFNRSRLGDCGLRVRIVREICPDLDACDVLMLDSKFFRSWWRDRADAALALLERLREQVPALLYFDNGDSSSWIKNEVLPFVRRYYKGSLLRDRSWFTRPLYGQRLFTDYYYRTKGVEDDAPEWSTPVNDPADLDKFRVSWNAGLANYSLYGPYLAALYERLPLRPLLAYPKQFTPPSTARPIDISCRINVSYDRASVAYQRRAMRDLLQGGVHTERLSRRAYFRELDNSKVVVSPFGWGEINLRDFEVFLSGGLLFKPDMSHMETWPDLFQSGRTMLTHNWDLSDCSERLREALADYGSNLEIARAGQELYRDCVATEQGHQAFCARFHEIVQDALAKA